MMKRAQDNGARPALPSVGMAENGLTKRELLALVFSVTLGRGNAEVGVAAADALLEKLAENGQ